MPRPFRQTFSAGAVAEGRTAGRYYFAFTPRGAPRFAEKTFCSAHGQGPGTTAPRGARATCAPFPDESLRRPGLRLRPGGGGDGAPESSGTPD